MTDEMKQQAKLYKEYMEWVKKENEPGLKAWVKDMKEQDREYSKRLEKYENKLKRISSLRRKDKRKIKEWRKSWWRRNFTVKPYFPHRWKPTMPLSPLCLYVAKEHESYEGFMQWLVNVKYK